MRPEGTAGDHKILSFTDFLYRNISYRLDLSSSSKHVIFWEGGGLCDTRNPIILMHVVCVRMAPTPVVVHHQVSPVPQIVHSVRFVDRNKKPWGQMFLWNQQQVTT